MTPVLVAAAIALVVAPLPPAARAGVPEPDAIFYGSAMLNGVAAPANARIVARSVLSPPTDLASFEVTVPGDPYVLRVPLENTLGGSVDPTKARVNDNVAFFIAGVPAGNAMITERGTLKPQALVANGTPPSPGTPTRTATPGPTGTSAPKTATPTGVTRTPTPTVTSTPTPARTQAHTPTPNVTASPSKDLMQCRAKVAKGTAGYFRARMKALLSCERKKVQRKVDPSVSCVMEPGVQESHAKASVKLEDGIDAKCGGTDDVCGGAPDFGAAMIGFEATCPDFRGGNCSIAVEPDLCGGVASCTRCLSDEPAEATAAFLFAELEQTDPKSRDKRIKALNKCQQAIVNAVGGFVAAKSNALQTCWASVDKGKAVGDCPAADGKAEGKIQAAVAKLQTKICKACGGADKTCGGASDFAPSDIGFPPSCADVDVPGPSPACQGTVGTLDDLVRCVTCVAEYEVDCADRAAVPWLATYPSECLR